MPYKSRGIYKEEGKVRDYNLFVIVAEGSKREVEYLMPFDIVDRIKVVNIPQTTEEKGSSPDHVQARMERYINDEGLSEADNDTLWCVIDVDQWPQANINSLADFCKKHPCTSLIVSNPCFEAWLLYHKLDDLSGIDCSKSQNLKNALGAQNPGGYNYHAYIPLIETAIKNARTHDSNPSPMSYMPAVGGTKMYLLAESLMSNIGAPRWEKFMKELPHIDVVFDENGLASIRVNK